MKTTNTGTVDKNSDSRGWIHFRLVTMALLLSPTLLTPPLHWQFVTCLLPIGLLDGAIALLLWSGLSKEPSMLRRAITDFVVWGAIICSLVLLWVGFSLTPSILYLFLACLIGVACLSYRTPAYPRLLLSLIVSGAICTKLLLSCLALMVDTEDALYGTSKPNYYPPYVGVNIRTTGRRYRIIYGNEDIVVGFPYTAEAQVYQRDFRGQPTPTKDCFQRFVQIDDEYVAIANPYKGFYLLKRDDLKTSRTIYEKEGPGIYYLGIVYQRSTKEIIGLRTDGKLFVFDYPGLKLKREWSLPVSGNHEEHYNELTLFQDRYLIANEQIPPHLVLYNLETQKQVARQFMGGVPGNLSSVDNGETFFVINFPLSGLEHRNVSDLQVLKTYPLGFGFRYHAILPDKRHVAVGNYITGEVWIINLESGNQVGPFQTGIRLQWLSVSPDGEFLDASHFQGLSRFRIEDLITSPISISPAAMIPFWILRPIVVMGILRDSIGNLGIVALNWLLFFTCVWLYRRTLLNETRDEGYMLGGEASMEDGAIMDV